MTGLPLVFNPRSGAKGKDLDGVLARLPREVRERLQPIPFGPPWDYRPLIEQAQAAAGPLLVWGGDGTLHHAGRALVEAGCPVPLAAVPGGSGNGLVRGLRTPLEPAKAITALLAGRALSMDLPRLDGVPFLNVCGTGFEARIAHAFDHAEGRGFRTYARLCAHQWKASRPLALRWQDGGGCPSEAWSLCFANLPQYGSGLWIAPDADPVDGQLEWVALRRPSLLDLLFRTWPLFQEHGRTSLRTQGRLQKARLELETELPWQLDGEPVPARRQAELTLEPKAFRIQVTAACPWR